MKPLLLFLLFATIITTSGCLVKKKHPTYKATVFRDNYGVPHVYGETDADVIFGSTYARAQDEFHYIESAYIKLSGQSAAIKGADLLKWDVFIRKLQLVEHSKQEYLRAPMRVKKLCKAFAAGMNYYLDKNPTVKPKLITHFEPWHALLGYRIFHVSGIGDNTLELINEKGVLENFTAYLSSTMWAISPKKSATGNAMLMINPHIPLDAPYEMHLHSQEGLTISGQLAYGIGIMPISGHNGQISWSLTANEPHINDVYIEKFLPENPRQYKYGDEIKELITWQDTIVKKNAGGSDVKKYQFEKTHNGPLFLNANGVKVALKVAKISEGNLLEQFYNMSLAQNLEQFKTAISPMDLTYNNIAYAGNDGHIYYVYNGAIAKRNPLLNWNKPLDGSNPNSGWQTFFKLDELPYVQDPPSGFIQNSNSSPFLTTIDGNPNLANFPSYIFRNGKEPDSAIANRSRVLLENNNNITFNQLSSMAFDTYLPYAASHLSALKKEWGEMNRNEPDKAAYFNEPIKILSQWDFVSRANSVASALYYGMFMQVGREEPYPWLRSLDLTMDTYEKTHGNWSVPLGKIIRLQRASRHKKHNYNDASLSLPAAGMPFYMGSIFTFNTHSPDGSIHNYGQHGHSYIGLVEFSNPVKSKSIMAFGQSRDPDSQHYFDQAPLYVKGQFKQAWFHKEDVIANASSSYTLTFNEEE